jgi:hypothetical protein
VRIEKTKGSFIPELSAGKPEDFRIQSALWNRRPWVACPRAYRNSSNTLLTKYPKKGDNNSKMLESMFETVRNLQASSKLLSMLELEHYLLP